MRASVLLLLVTLSSSGCGFVRAQRPVGLDGYAQPLDYERPWGGPSGTELAGYRLEAGFRFLRFMVVSGRARSAGGDHTLEIWDGEAVAWKARCSTELDYERVPDVWLACVYAPAGGAHAPLSLGLTATGERPMHGAYLTERGAWLVEGTRTVQAGSILGHTIGWSILRRGADRVAVFVDEGMLPAQFYVDRELSPEDLRDLAPLLLTLLQTGDVRVVFGRTGVSFGPSEDARPFPPPPPLPEAPTAHQRHVQTMLDIGETDAAHVLYAIAKEYE